MNTRTIPLAVKFRLLRTRRALRGWRNEAVRSSRHAERCREGHEPDLMVMADTQALATLLAEEGTAIAQIGLAAGPKVRSVQAALAADLAVLAHETRACHLTMREALLRS